ncbi:MAG: beta-propeller domain-containing protein, partial [Pirellulales bacterium]
TELDGRYADSRSVDGFVYLVLDDAFALPGPLQIPVDEEDAPGDAVNRAEDRFARELVTTDLISGELIGGKLTAPSAPAVYQTEQEYVAWIEEQFDQLLDDVLPQFTSYAADREFVRGGRLADAGDILLPEIPDRNRLLLVTAIDATSSEPGPVSSVAIPASGAGQIYASLDNLYVFDDGPQRGFWGVFGGDSEEQTTGILKFSWNAESGRIDLVATGEVPGALNNQFSVDEYNGQLRLVTTSWNTDPGRWRSRSSNQLFVLADNRGVLEGLGSLQGLAPEETVRSVRFMGDRAFVVTFRNVDPLFALDLSDPTDPREVGQLKIPGFSSYLQFVGESYLIGIGRNTPDGWNGPPQVTLFDVSDMRQPRVVDQFTWERWSQTEAANDHLAVGYFPEHDLLTIPVGFRRRESIDEDGDGFRDETVWRTEDDLYVFRLGLAPSDDGQRAEPGLELAGTVSHDWQVRRSGYIADRLFSLSTDDLIVSDIADPSTPIAAIEFGRRASEDGPVDPDGNSDNPSPTPWDGPLGDIVQTVRKRMADRLRVGTGQVGLVAAEMDPREATYTIVVQAEETMSLYKADRSGSIELATADFAFSTAATTLTQNQQNPLDVNADAIITPLDALVVINRLNAAVAKSNRVAPLRQIGDSNRVSVHADVDGDGILTPLDALRVINYLNAHAAVVAATAETPAQPATEPVTTMPLVVRASSSTGDRSIGSFERTGSATDGEVGDSTETIEAGRERRGKDRPIEVRTGDPRGVELDDLDRSRQHEKDAEDQYEGDDVRIRDG